MAIGTACEGKSVLSTPRTPAPVLSILKQAHARDIISLRGLGFKVDSSGFRIQGSGFRV
jgi:hypothetical protein